MPSTPAINGVVSITVVDNAGNSVLKTFNNVTAVNFDYFKGTVNIVAASGSFFFPLLPITTVTYTVVTGLGGSTTVVMS